MERSGVLAGPFHAAHAIRRSGLPLHDPGLSGQESRLDLFARPRDERRHVSRHVGEARPDGLRHLALQASAAAALDEDAMPPVAAAVIALVGLVLVFSAVWAWQLKSENAGMIDPVWAYSLGAVAVLYAVLGTGDPSSRALVALGGLIWGARLGTHLWRRNFGQPEDARYRRFREEWGDAAPRRMFWFFQLQVVISLLLSAAFLVPSYRSSEPATGWMLPAAAVWIVSVTGEALADRQ